jgi:peptide/nickel transport system ATP-binding protein
VLEARNVSFGHPGADPILRNVSLAIEPGEVLGLDGPSGVGKSTLGRLLAGLLEPEAGAVRLDGKALPRAGFCPVQMLFQSPELAVNSRWTAGRILREAFEPDPSLLDAFGIRPAWLERFPHELSGGELQRIATVRALAPPLRFLVADEITASLDPLTQAEIWRALLALAAERRLGLLVIGHDAPLLARVATRRVRLAGADT